tara:strand:- start:281 stop:850 length:570 start_codon:yes stop_codon:yes gene_type:complete
MKIEDGKGKNGDASVSAVQRLNVSSKTGPRMFYISRDDGLTFDAISIGDNDYAAGEYCFYLKNTSATRNLYIQHLEFHSTDACRLVIDEVTGTAAGGTVIVPSNLNLGSGLLGEATSMGGGAAITGLTKVKQIGTHRNAALADSEMDYQGSLILSPNKAIAVEYDAEYGGTTGIIEIDAFFWFETIGAT